MYHVTVVFLLSHTEHIYLHDDLSMVRTCTLKFMFSLYIDFVPHLILYTFAIVCDDGLPLSGDGKRKK